MAIVAAQQMIEALDTLFGVHPGCRPVHARGLVLAGEFTASPIAARLTRAAHMQGNPVAVIARFSGSSGYPGWPDYLPDARGLAVSFHLPEGERTDIVAATLPRFPVRKPEDFLSLVRALQPRPALLWRLPWFLLRHPGVLRSLPANALSLARPPASYVSLVYHAIHAFKWITPYGSERHVRYRWVPEQRLTISWRAALCAGAHYLEEELRERLHRGAVRMHLQLQVARPGDPVRDPSAPWPASRDIVTVGTLELRSLADAPAVLSFDPLRLIDGIVASDDPVLRFRQEVYALAANRRQASAKVRSIRAA
ncbi:MAG: catalase [Moraxellaceae bacterium]|jgi:catalase|nr:catalase [Moraxellaceae bacterium]